MNEKKYKKLVTEFYRCINQDEVKNALEYNRPAQIVDAMQDILEKAISKSAMGCYNGLPHYFTGRKYESLSKDEFVTLVNDIMRKCGVPNGCYARVEGMARFLRLCVKRELRINPNILVMKNCVFDISTRKTYKFNKKYVQVTAMDFDYNEHEYPILWQKFLDRVLPDKTLQKILQEFLGSLFVQRCDTKTEKVLILKGAGANGKSVIFETVVGILGRENITHYSLGALVKKSNEQLHNIACINGKSLNYCSEIQTGRLSNEEADTLKHLISREPIPARQLFGKAYTAYDIPPMMTNANRMPYLNDWSEGMRRRLIVIPFDESIPEGEQDPQLAIKLRAEYPGILNWMLAGRNRFIAQGYKYSHSSIVDDIAEDCQAETSPVIQFMLEKNYRKEPKKDDDDPIPRWVEARKLYIEYGRWCIANNQEAETERKFGAILIDNGYFRKRSSDGNLYRVYVKRKVLPAEYKNKTPKATARGIKELAHWCNETPALINSLMKKGLLEDTFYKEGFYYIFDIEKVQKIVRRYHRKEKKKMAAERTSDGLKYERKVFNARMRSKKEPFRKYGAVPHKSTENIIYVTDDFNYDLHKDNYESFIKEHTI